MNHKKVHANLIQYSTNETERLKYKGGRGRREQEHNGKPCFTITFNVKC